MLTLTRLAQPWLGGRSTGMAAKMLVARTCLLIKIIFISKVHTILDTHFDLFKTFFDAASDTFCLAKEVQALGIVYKMFF